MKRPKLITLALALCLTTSVYSCSDSSSSDEPKHETPTPPNKPEEPKDPNPEPEKPNTTIKKSDVAEIMQRVADREIQVFKYTTDKNLHDYGINAWTKATLYRGMVEWSNLSNNNKYDTWLKTKVGDAADWAIAANFKNNPNYSLYHADELCMGFFYLKMYEKHKDAKMKASVQERIDWIIANPGKQDMSYKNKQSWTWSDVLFMAPPVYALLGKVENSDKYTAYMDKEYKRTYEHLYDKEKGLFFRDDSYFAKTENNGEKVFWGRGNGWVAAGLVDILKTLPKGSQYRAFYEKLFGEFVPHIAKLQDEKGFWHASLLDPESYPSPETSATSLITYAIAYGLNEGYISKDQFQPVLDKAWKALISAVNEEGKLGWVQPIGADPKKVTEEMTADFGAGAFLLAASEVYRMGK